MIFTWSQEYRCVLFMALLMALKPYSVVVWDVWWFEGPNPHIPQHGRIKHLLMRTLKSGDLFNIIFKVLNGSEIHFKIYIAHSVKRWFGKHGSWDDPGMIISENLWRFDIFQSKLIGKMVRTFRNYPRKEFIF